ncbi:hypothetical protein LDI01_20310 [Lentilactobacillus diolivorans]|uniref:Uncharacterized protein n=1 Tax=Lentilactobacillus diolivorans TaxID=179838 RepID=A0ABQ0XGG3_9LACO|nr:hypothetical protein LDI01_20310 [Lentilactobacillus diolivorans]
MRCRIIRFFSKKAKFEINAMKCGNKKARTVYLPSFFITAFLKHQNDYYPSAIS